MGICSGADPEKLVLTATAPREASRRRLPVVGLLLLVLSMLWQSRPTAADDTRPPQKVALLVGVDQYLKPGFADLQYAEADVVAVGEELKRLGFQVTVLLGSGKGEQQATLANIEAAAHRLVAPLGKNDLVIVMLSGHGQQLDPSPMADPAMLHFDRMQPYYCPVDALVNRPETQFSLTYLLDEILAPNVRTKLLLVDACRDVPIDRSRGARNAKGIEGRVVALPEETGVFFSCRAGQQSFEREELGHGLFTYCLLEGLRGQAQRNGEVTWADLVAHVSFRMAQPELTGLLPTGMRQVPIPAGAVPHTVLGRIGELATLAPVPMPTPTDPLRAQAKSRSLQPDLRFVNSETALALLVRPEQALTNPLVRDRIQQIEEALPDFSLEDQLQLIPTLFGIDVHQIDHVLMVIDRQQMAQLLSPGLGTTPGDSTECQVGEEIAEPETSEWIPTLVTRFVEEIDRESFEEKFAQHVEVKSIGSITYYSTPLGLAVWLPDSTTMVLCDEPKIQELLGNQIGTPGPLAQLVAERSKYELSLVADATLYHALAGSMVESDPSLAVFAAYLKQVNSVAMIVDLQGETLLELQFDCMNDGSAAGLDAMFEMGMEQGREVFAADPEVFPWGAELLSAIRAESKDALWTVRVARWESLEQWSHDLLAANLVQISAERRLDRLQKISLAFCNYEILHRCLPALGGSGEKFPTGVELSWRVHLLPFLGERELYDEFHLNEAWNSAHNRTLLARMPAVYGRDPEGKTTVHVFTGPGAPFSNVIGLQISQIADGRSQTILAVEAGPETADYWTRPGGLTVSESDPWKSLGTITEGLPTVLMDCVTGVIPTTVEAQTLMNLIRHSDGNPVEIPW